MDLINELKQDKLLRYDYLERDLFAFGMYYFSDTFKNISPLFHRVWAEDMMTDKHLLIIAFREAAKTVWAMIKIIHSIVYRKKRFIMFYCYDKKKAGSKLYDIVVQLQSNKDLILDYGEIFPKGRNEDDTTTRKSVLDFVTRNQVKVKASSIGESPRGEMFFTKNGSFRPDFIILDDIDVDKSVMNVDIIEKNYLWLKGELMGGMSDEAQILFLGNIIKADGIIPRFEKDYKESEYWIVRRKAIKENGEITWKERYTEEDLIKKKNLLGEISYNQNMLLIPYSGGDTIVKRSQIQYKDILPSFDDIIIGVDPAISTKTKSDSFAIVVTGIIGDNFYIIEAIELIGEQKDPFKATQVVKNLYIKHNANKVIVETVAFQQVMATLFKNEGIATEEVKPSRDKVTRLMEKQFLFEQGKVWFNTEGTQALVNQLLEFPNVLHDDLVDAMVYSFRKKKKSFTFVNL